MSKIASRKISRNIRKAEYETYSSQGLNIGLCMGLVVGTATGSVYGKPALYMIGFAFIGLIVGVIIGSQIKRKNR